MSLSQVFSTMMKRCTLSLVLILAVVQAEVITLTPDNFDEVASGKNVFIKYFAPWCEHSKAIKEDWEKLAEDFKDHENLIIAEVNCDEHEDFCHFVEGFPTLAYGSHDHQEEYRGSRDYEMLKAFTEEQLMEPFCSLTNIDACEQDEKEAIEKFQSISVEELVAIVDKIEEEAVEAEALFDAEVEKIHEAYEALVDEFNEKVSKLKEERKYDFARVILHSRQETAEEL